MENKTIVVAGHICLDITPTFLNDKINKVGDILIPGHLIQVGKADVHVGGVVSNTGLALKFLGADVKLMGLVGKDAFGQMVLSQLDSMDAREGMLISEEGDTSYSVVVAPNGIDRIFLHESGVNDIYRESNLNFDVIKQASLFHFGYPPLMRTIYENNGEELVKIFKHVKELGLATSLDMAAVDENSPVGKVDWEGILERVLPYVDFFVPSIEELVYMTDKTRYYEWVKRADGGDFTTILDPETDIRPVADNLMEFGAKVVMIKCGAPGIYLKTASKDVLTDIGGGLAGNMAGWADKNIFEKSYKPEKVLSGTGAGDTSIAAFLYAITKGCSCEKCLQLAAATGASCVEGYDALSGLKTFDVLEAKIAQGWEKNIF
ncbi:MAG: carbohydrate kinase family protein [Lachnospiraceae bacterium]|nr:carbohydrate kinase family protein [Lachnospiraceae bacterium]